MNKENKVSYIKSVISYMGEIDLSYDNKKPCIKDNEISYQLVNKMFEHRVEAITYDFNTKEEIDTDSIDYIEYGNLPDHIIEQLFLMVQNWEQSHLLRSK